MVQIKLTKKNTKIGFYTDHRHIKSRQAKLTKAGVVPVFAPHSLDIIRVTAPDTTIFYSSVFCFFLLLLQIEKSRNPAGFWGAWINCACITCSKKKPDIWKRGIEKERKIKRQK